MLENLLSNALSTALKVESPLIEVGVMPATNPLFSLCATTAQASIYSAPTSCSGCSSACTECQRVSGHGGEPGGVHNIIRRHGERDWARNQPWEGRLLLFPVMGTAEAQQRAARQVHRTQACQYFLRAQWAITVLRCCGFLGSLLFELVKATLARQECRCMTMPTANATV